MKKYAVCLFIGIILLWAPGYRTLSAADQEIKNLPVIKKKIKTGFSNGGWEADRYRNMATLDAHRSIVIADLEGPGVIRHIHTTRHYKRPISTRGVVLLIYFDGTDEPAVQCPLGDFFGDGCNGKSMNFSTPLIECAPGSYNTYIPMPFKTRARVVLRNDTNIDLDNYSYVEWESPEEADWEAIRSDWEAVGDDLRVALGWARVHYSRSSDGEPGISETA